MTRGCPVTGARDRAPGGSAVPFVLALALTLAAAAAAPAQTRPKVLEYTVPEIATASPEPAGRTGRPLQGPQVQRLLQAQAMRDAGKFDIAHDILASLLAESPHQPVVLAEMARLHSDRQQWAALERMARGERTATRDSLLLGRELAFALERMSRPKDAAQVIFEVWLTAPAEGEWAEPVLIRLEGLDPKGVREVSRRAAESHIERIEIVRFAARLAWKGGDGPGALKLLATADAHHPSTPARWGYAEELLYAGTARDTSGAIDALVDLAADQGLDPAYRLPAARRVWQISTRRAGTHDGVLRVARALSDLPPTAWAQDLLVGVVRELRQSGNTADVRALLDKLGDRRDAVPELKLEGALNELRDGPTDKALATLEKAAHGNVEGVFRYAEALYFAGMPDSAASLYRLVSHDPAGPFTGAALERLFLIEDAQPREALPAFGRLAFDEWRGDSKHALALSDSLFHGLSRGPLWAQAAVTLATQRERAGDPRAALEPLLALADSLPDDRLAPVARQRAGDLYRLRLKDDAKALAQYEECLTRYPKAWNASEVRRVVETLRRERRF